MTTTFGDLVLVAQRHLRAAYRADLSVLTSDEHAHVMGSLARCVRAVHLLWRTVDRPDRPFRDGDSAWHRAGKELSTGLTVASRSLERVGKASSEHTPPAPALQLVAAGVAIGASHDLLATHTQLIPSGQFDRTGMMAVIDGPDGRRAVVVACAEHLPYLVKMAETLGKTSVVSRPAREAALRASEALHGTERAIDSALILMGPPRDVLSGVRLVEPLRRHRVRDDESPQELLRQAVLGIERLHRVALEELASGPSERHTSGALANVSTAMAVVAHVTSRLLRQVAPETAGTGTHPRIGSLIEAADSSERSATAWETVRRSWRGIRSLREHGPSEIIRAEASDLTIRIGRVAHGDGWLPRPDASRLLRTAPGLAGSPEEFAGLLDGLQSLADGSSSVAMDHTRLISKLSSREELLVPTRSLANVDIPRGWSAAPTELVEDLRRSLFVAQAAADEVSRFLRDAQERLIEQTSRSAADAFRSRGCGRGV